MKKKTMAMVLAGALAVSAMAGCGNSSSSSTTAAAGEKTAETTAADSQGSTAAASEASKTDYPTQNVNGIVQWGEGGGTDSLMRPLATLAQDKLGQSIVVQNMTGGTGSIATQYVYDQNADGYNLLIVNMVTSGSSDTAKGIMELAGDVPVIFFNRAVDEDGVEASASVLNAYENIAFVGTDAPEAGHLQGKMVGEYVLEHYDELDLNGDGKISYAMFKGDEANVEAIYRTQYGVEDATAVLPAAGKPELVYFDANNTSGYQVDLNGQWSAAAALDYMNTNLSQYNEGNNNMIELIICNNDNMAEGCISALESAGYNNGTGKTIPVFGVDATDSAKELIANGKMTGTVKQDAEGMAAAIAQIAKAVGEGTALKDAVAATAESNTEMYSVAEGVATKLYVAYAPYTA